jgi:HNH endonuclease
MNFWWVNQNQTFEQETNGGYLWSPKRNQNGARNQFYDYMTRVIPGDIVFSFKGTLIKAIGVIQSNGYASPQPLEFGRIGNQWGSNGWKVDVKYFFLDNQIKPSEHMDVLAPELPQKYSPLQTNGKGNQGVYLTLLPQLFATKLVQLIGKEARDLVQKLSAVQDKDILEQEDAVSSGLAAWEEELENAVRANNDIPLTERETIILSRRGQGIYRSRVEQIERCCRVTKVNELVHLRASHIKPWRHCEDHVEKLNGNNGLMLTPSIDHLFDRGFISFEDSGDIIISPIANRNSLARMGLDLNVINNVGLFNDDQRYFMQFHRDEIFLR